MRYRNEPPFKLRGTLAAAFALAAAGTGMGLAQRGEPSRALERVDAVIPRPVTLAAVRVVREARVPRQPRLGADARMSTSQLSAAERLVRDEVRRGGFPGAALAAGRGAHLGLMAGVGNAEWGHGAVDPERTVYDIASLTKVVATTTAVMLLVEQGRMDVDAPVSRYLPAFSGGAKDKVRIRHLLAHNSGLPAGAGVGGTPEQALKQLIRTPLKSAPGERMEYSDVGFVVLWAAAERAAGEPLDGMLRREMWEPLGMRSTGFNPGEGCTRCVPTMKRADGTPVRGKVHDPTARRLGGVAGNAGLFSTAADLARFAAMLASGGELEGVRVLEEETIRRFTRRQPNAENRALGWETPLDRGGSAGRELSRRAFGHTGFTGTSLWVDPERATWTVLLANRTFDPHAPNRIQALRRAVNDRVAQAADAGGRGMGVLLD
jgi:CubicO group peptidase (beta-lactamase class C family)